MTSKLRALLLAAALGCAGAGQASAQADSPVTKINAEAARAEITTTPLRGGLSMLEGSGGNITVLARPDGKFMVDAGIAVSRPRVEAALNQLGGGPVKYLANTHWHWDHTDGNPWVHDLGAVIVATPNTLKYVSRSERVEDWNFTFQPLPPAGRPTEILARDRTMKFGGTTILIRPYEPSHTDGDLSVYFVEPDVLATGDTFWNGVYPFIDNAHGGGIDGMIRAVNVDLGRVTDKTLIVPGHGPVGNRAQLAAFRDMLVGVRDNVAALKAQGKSLDEVLAAKPTAAYDAKWGNFVIDPAFFTRLVYQGL
ncbi:MBL fold metallo-hydrolase [Caulobacter sp. 17J80-11]|uniref:MBL fold metallo-hydrolase n=1 Tax=Caulobacter sp. 17J80-11 TaxID=2763502 RepID=UPI0016536238|nr:MBL fold metallo-hydrolase [Caulobacter sp. 17J80-11]MBC6982469.1 MBL fold metallo-hydrolase [Caulobacter sp. 17J80-11]